MLTISKQQLHEILESGLEDSDLKAFDIREIIAGQGISENHVGGDDMILLADEILDAIKCGYAIATWYGPDTEVLVVGYKSDQLTIND